MSVGSCHLVNLRALKLSAPNPSMSKHRGGMIWEESCNIVTNCKTLRTLSCQGLQGL